MPQMLIDQFFKVTGGTKRRKVSIGPDIALKKEHINVTEKSNVEVNMLNNTQELKRKHKIDVVESIDNKNVRSSNNLYISQCKSKFVPKVPSPIKEGQNKMANPKIFFTGRIDMQLTIQAIEYLNLAKQGAIIPNNFNLAEIYKSNSFKVSYNHVNTATSVRYEISDIITPTETYSILLFTIIVNVLSNPINCGYFNEEELDSVFSLLTLSAKAQMLFVRMLKRKRSWHRLSNIKHLEIDDNLQPIFEELVQHTFCASNIEKEEIHTMLQLLQVDEIRKICQEVKTSGSGKKETNISALLKLCNTTKPLFPGAKSPTNVLRSLIINKLGYCIRLTHKAINLFNKIFTLFIPNQDPKKNISDIFFMLLNIQRGQIIYPETFPSCFPIFRDTEHLLSYIESKNVLSEILNSIEKKTWKVVQKLGLVAYDRFFVSLDSDLQSLQMDLPLHVKHFMPSYIWLKVISKSIIGFKKNSNTIPQAVKFLKTLIDQTFYMQSKKGQWYAELALIEMHHKKDLGISAQFIVKALSTEILTEVDRIDLIERAKRIAKRRKGIKADIKENIQTIVDMYEKRQIRYQPVCNVVKATLVRGNTTGKKNKWCIACDTNNWYYGSVEQLALYHYKHQGYSKGVHCEGSLPVILFATLFWEEIYEIDIPGAWVSTYQSSPEDLYTETFYSKRRKQIDIKFNSVRNLTTEALSIFIEDKFKKYCKYVSLMYTDLFASSFDLKEVVQCLGVEAVMGICGKLINNFKLWNSGFPDLFVWDPKTKNCKIAEVKGPSDTLSTKQELWLQYLDQLGLDTEVCKVIDAVAADIDAYIDANFTKR